MVEIIRIRTEEEQKQAREMFDNLRDELLKRDLSNTENYDKSVLTLSAASLGFSLTAIRFIVPLEVADYLWLIISGWLLLLGSIITSLVAFLVSNEAIATQMKNNKDYYIDGLAKAFKRKNIYSKINKILNYATGLMFAVAITAIVAFVILNVNSGVIAMSEKCDEKPTDVSFDSANVDVVGMLRVPGDLDVSAYSANTPAMQRVPESTIASQSSSGSKSNSVSNETPPKTDKA